MATAVYDFIVVGAGLSGLTTAMHIMSAMSSEGAEGKPRGLVVEARPRVGGRTANTAGFDAGGAWCWARHNPHLTSLADGLGVSKFKQPVGGAAHGLGSGRAVDVVDLGERVVPTGHGDYQGRYRFEGGAVELSNVLRWWLEAAGVEFRLGARVVRVAETAAVDSLSVTESKTGDFGDGGDAGTPGLVSLELEVDAATPSTADVSADGDAGPVPAPHLRLQAKTVVVAVPPRVAAKSITFAPPLPPDRAEAMLSTPTWMSLTAKVIAVYDKAVWAEAGFSGEATSHVGPASQWYDASMPSSTGAADPPALCGFLFGPPAVELAAELAAGHTRHTKMDAAVRAQLQRMFPSERGPRELQYHVWAADRDTTGEVGVPKLSEHLMGHPRKNPVLRKPHGSVVFASAETAVGNPGLLDGAVEAGIRAAKDARAVLGRKAA